MPNKRKQNNNPDNLDKETKRKLKKKKKEIEQLEGKLKNAEESLNELLEEKDQLLDKKSGLLSNKSSAKKELEKKKKKEEEIKKAKQEIEKREQREEDPDKKKKIERERWDIEDERRILEKKIWEEEDEIEKIENKISKIKEQVEDLEENKKKKVQDKKEEVKQKIDEKKKEIKVIKRKVKQKKQKEAGSEEEQMLDNLKETRSALAEILEEVKETELFEDDDLLEQSNQTLEALKEEITNIEKKKQKASKKEEKEKLKKEEKQLKEKIEDEKKNIEEMKKKAERKEKSAEKEKKEETKKEKKRKEDEEKKEEMEEETDKEKEGTAEETVKKEDDEKKKKKKEELTEDKKKDKKIEEDKEKKDDKTDEEKEKDKKEKKEEDKDDEKDKGEKKEKEDEKKEAAEKEKDAKVDKEDQKEKDDKKDKKEEDEEDKADKKDKEKVKSKDKKKEKKEKDKKEIKKKKASKKKEEEKKTPEQIKEEKIREEIKKEVEELEKREKEKEKEQEVLNKEIKEKIEEEVNKLSEKRKNDILKQLEKAYSKAENRLSEDHQKLVSEHTGDLLKKLDNPQVDNVHVYNIIKEDTSLLDDAEDVKKELDQKIEEKEEIDPFEGIEREKGDLARLREEMSKLKIPKIAATIKRGREEGMTDKKILEKIIEENPDEAEILNGLRDEGISPSLLLEELIKDSREASKVPQKEEVEKEKDKDKKEDSKKAIGVERSLEDEDFDMDEVVGEEVSAVKGFGLVSRILSSTRNLSVGVDISDHSIEIMLLAKDGTITSYGRSVLREGIVQNGEIVNQKALSKILKNTLKTAEPRPLHVPEHTREKKRFQFRSPNHKAIISLPDAKTYIQVFEFSDNLNLYKKIEKRVKTSVPFEYDELYWDYINLPKKGGKTRVLCVAALRDMVDMYIYFFKSTNIEPVAFDIEGASIGRALLPIKNLTNSKKRRLKDKRERMIIDMGARTSILNIYDKKGNLILSASLPYAGHYFTKKVADYFNIPKDKAEVLKQKYGFKPDGKIMPALEEHGEKIVKEIERAKNYYESEFGGRVREVILAGGTVLLPNMVDFLDERVKDMKVRVGDPLSKINDKGLLDKKSPVLYSNVIGLGIRSLVDDPINEGVNLLPEELKSKAKQNKEKKDKSMTMASAFLAISGIVLLAAVIYYLIYFPVPEFIQPLQDRITDRAEDQTETVTVSDQVGQYANLYDSDGESVGEVLPGETLSVIIVEEGWVQVEFNESFAWIEEDNVIFEDDLAEREDEEDEPEEDVEEEDDEEEDEGEDEGDEEEIPEPVEVDFFEVSQLVGGSGLNFREDPDPTATAITALDAGSVHQILDEVDGWYMTEFDGETGWVSSDFANDFQEYTEPGEEVEELINRLTD